VEVYLKWVQPMTFVARGEKGWTALMDAKAEAGGEVGSPAPMEVFLSSLGGCTGMDVVYFLRKMKSEPERFEVRVEGERREEHPRLFKRVKVVYAFWGDLDPSKLAKAVELSFNKYCGVIGTLREAGCELSREILLNGERVGES